jgi:RNA ligase (TIGR02306 family)
MTKAVAEIIKVDNLNSIPDSDFLNVAQVGGYQIVIRKADFQLGDLGLFISVDSVVPYEFLEFYNLHEVISKGRIRTKKLRGVVSQGLLLPLTHPELQNAQVGDDFAEKLNIVKYEPPVQFKGLDMRPWPTALLQIYDIESLQNFKWRDVFQEGEEVIVREKIHGKHMIMCLFQNEFHVCTRRTNLKRPDDLKKNEYWYIAFKHNFEEIMKQISQDFNGADIVIRGELFGPKCQFLHYGRKEVDFAVFDIEVNLGHYLPNNQFEQVCQKYNLQIAPLLYKGPFSISKMDELAELDSAISLNPNEISEGIVIKPTQEGFHPSLGRKFLKQIGKRYALEANKELEFADV